MKIFNKFKVILILASIFVGIIYLYPYSYYNLLKHEDRVLYPFSFAETLYAAQVKEIIDGNFSVGDPQFFEHKQVTPSVFPYICVFLIATVSYITGSIVWGFLVSDFIFPVILFLLLYTFGILLTHNRLCALLASFSTLFLYHLLAKFPPISIEGIREFLKIVTWQQVSGPLPFYRTPNPQISFIFLALSLFILYGLWLKPDWKITSVLIVAANLLYSVYFYHVTYFIFITLILLFTTLFKRDKKQFISLFTLLCSLCITGIAYLQISKIYPYQTLQVTGGKFEMRYFDWIYSLRYGIFFIILLFLTNGINNSQRVFSGSLVLAGLGVMNFQVLTGWTIQPGHWPQTTVEPVITFLLCLYIGRLLITKISSFSMCILILCICIYAVIWQIHFSQRAVKDWSIPRDLNNVLIWLNTNSTTQTVVLALDIEVSAYVPVLTSANIFLPVEEYHYATVDEIWQRILLAYKIYKVPKYFFNPSVLPLVTYFELTYNLNQYKHEDFREYDQLIRQRIKNCYPSLCASLYSLPMRIKDYWVEQFALKIDLEKNPFRLDYIIYSPNDKKKHALFPTGTLVYRSGEYRVFAYKR